MTKLSEKKGIDDWLKNSGKLQEHEPPRVRKEENKISKADIFSLYKGDSPAYIAQDRHVKYTLRDLERDSEAFEGWLSNELSNIYSNSEKSRPVKFGDTSNRFEDLAKHYIESEGKDFQQYAKSNGRQFYNLIDIKTGDIGDAVAAVSITGNEATMYGSRNFNRKAADMAAQYGIPKTWAERYAVVHEMGHLAEKGKRYGNHVGMELANEHMLKGYFQEKAAMYNSLASIANHRASNVASNYGFGKGVSSYNAKGAGKTANYSAAKAA